MALYISMRIKNTLNPKNQFQYINVFFCLCSPVHLFTLRRLRNIFTSINGSGLYTRGEEEFY